MNDFALALAALLARFPAGFRPVDPPVKFIASNGWSGAAFIRWNSAHGPLVLKVWPGDGPSPQEHRNQHRYLIGLSGFQPRLALPLADSAGNTVSAWPGGRSAELFPWIAGSPLRNPPTADQLAETMSALARLHRHWALAQPASNQPSHAVINRLNQLRILKYNKTLITSIPTLIATAPPPTREKFQEIYSLARWLLDRAVSWLELIQAQRFRTQVVLRDARPDHFLFSGDHLHGIIDFGAIGLDNVAVDLARLLNDWFPGDKLLFNQALLLYQKESPLNDAEIRLMHALGLAGSILGGLAWVDLYFRKGRSHGREEAFQTALDLAISRLRSYCYDRTDIQEVNGRLSAGPRFSNATR